MASDKVFVDLDEEIVFTTEKILQAATKRVILVIPESANLVTSFVSLKLLARQINRSDKITVLVTEDKLGLKLAGKAGLVVKEKISDITPEVWVEAEELKKKFLESRKELKETLIGQRTESSDYKILEDEDTKGSKEVAKDEKAKEEDPGFMPPLKDKPRLDPKVVNLGTIALVAGGDIEMHSELADEIVEAGAKKDPISRDKPKAEKDLENQSKQVGQDEVDEEEEVDEKDDIEKVQAERRQNVIGRDMSAYVQDVRPKRARAGGISGGGAGISGIFNDMKAKVVNFYSTGNTKAKAGVTGVIALVILYLLSTMVLASAKVTIYVTRDEVSVSQTIQGDENITEVDEESLIIPVRSIKESSNGSSSADTTGEAKDGNRAKGLITIYNKQEQEVTLTDGTKLENISTGLKYKVLGNVTIPAAVKISATDIDLGVKQDVQIEADNYGENYNTSGSKDYKVEGYTTDQLIAKSFNDITGGDTTDETAVSQEDIDDIREGLVDMLKNEIADKLDQAVSEESGEILLTEAIIYAKPKVTADKKVGDVAATVNVTVDLEATAYFVDEKDLRKVTALIIKQDSEFEGEVDEENLKTPVLSGASIEDGIVTFSVSSEGDITANLDKKELAGELSGLSISEAEQHIGEISGVEEYEVKVSPFYVPGFLKKIPSAGKIDIVIQEAK